MTSTKPEDNNVEIDDSLYSRQQLMLGAEAMKRMAKSSVLIAGLGGLGVEIAKNVGLAGIKALTLNDNRAATWLDLSTNFYLTPNDIGKNRAQTVMKHISELNPYVKYEVTEHDLSKVDLSYFDQFTCVILTDSPLSEQVRVNEYCHSKNIRFISAEVRGLYTYTFCDFGTEFEIFDKDGEELREVLLESVSRENPGVVKTLNGEKHQLEDGDLVTFREVRGMTELNGTTHTIKVINPVSFTIGDTSSFSPYQREGIVSQKKQTIKVTHTKLSESLINPEFVVADFAKFDFPNTLHIGLRALHAFHDAHSRFPAPWNKSEGDELIKIASDINSKSSSPIELNEKLLRLQAYTCQGSIVPLTSFTGGMAAQECLKALSGKYTPLKQWLHLDAVELMEPIDSNPDNFQPSNHRSDGQTICVGKELNKKLADLKLFMIGCGAIGCEMLKNFAMMGVSTSDKGVITVTDNDLIEKSNLNRQFLFRSKDIQKPKSESAANAVKMMNPEIRISAHLDKVGPDTQTKYSDEFFENLDIVVNALDNVNARLYVDQRCVTNRKPLLESGTLGPKGHVQVIIPHKTESYGSQRDPPEKDVPFCTLKSFPNLIEHCIEWARDFSFGGLFISKPMQWSQLLEQDNLVDRLNAPMGGGLDLKIVRTAAKLVKNQPRDFDDCLKFSRQKYQAYFVNKALQLLHSFPLDHKIDDKGTLFWTSPKRPPMVLEFDWNDPAMRNFVLTLANLYAEVWSIPRSNDMEHIRKVVESTPIAPFKPKEGKKIETDTSVKKEAAEQAVGPEDELEGQLKQLAKFFQSNTNVFKLKPIEFEKDDDTNFHIDFIAATANLRARMYAIPEVDRLKIKAIAGRIMPAIATTTSCVSGCVALELMKLVRNSDDISHFKNLFMNLALPFWSFSEPGPVAKQYITKEMYFTLWDNWEVKEGDITLGEFIDYFQKKYNLKVGGVLNGAMMIYVPMFPGHAKRKPQKMAQLLKKQPDDKYVDLIVTFTDEEDKDVSGPPIRYHY